MAGLGFPSLRKAQAEKGHHVRAVRIAFTAWPGGADVVPPHEVVDPLVDVLAPQRPEPWEERGNKTHFIDA